MTCLRSMSRHSAVVTWLACGALVGGACAHATTRAGSTSAYKVGTYHFEEFDRGSASRIQGIVTLAPDTAAMNLDVGYCQPHRRLFGDDAAVTFDCDGAAQVSRMRITIARWNPEQNSSWSGRVPSTSTTTTCASYNTLPTGERVCTRYQSQSSDTETPVGGRLRVVLISP